MKKYYSPVKINYSLADKTEKVTMKMNETADYLGISITCLKRLMKEDKIPHKRLGKRFYLFSKEAVDKWLKESDNL